MKEIRQRFEEICQQNGISPEDYINWMIRGFVESWEAMSDRDKKLTFETVRKYSVEDSAGILGDKGV